MAGVLAAVGAALAVLGALAPNHVGLVIIAAGPDTATGGLRSQLSHQ